MPPPNATKAGTLPVPALSPLPIERTTHLAAVLDDTRLRVFVEMLAPDRARRHGIAMVLRHCDACGGYSHLFRAREFAASYLRNLPCTGQPVVLVASSFYLREVVA